MSLPNYYTALFNAVTDALQAIENQNYGQAKEILIAGQQQAETLYLEMKTDDQGTDCHDQSADWSRNDAVV